MARSIIPIPGEGLQFIFVENGSLVQIKASVATYNDLPITGNSENDLRITRDTDRMYTWSIDSSTGNINDWQDIGQSISLDWSAITGKPTSTPADIDQAVNKRHTQNTDNSLRTDKLIVDVDGNVGIGTNDPDGFEVDKAVSETIQSRKNIRIGIAGNTPRIILEDIIGGQWEIDNNGGTLRFFKPGFGCVEIDAGGHFRINNQGNFVTGSGSNLYIDASGWLYKSTSSKKYKKDIDYNGVNANKVYDLKPVSFKSKADNKEFIGFIAEDVVKVEPRLVVMDINGAPDALNYGQFSALLTKAIQEIKVENDLLKKRIELLEQKII